MRSPSFRILVLALAGASLFPVAAVAGARYFASGGPSGHSNHGFAGGRGMNGGVELPIHPTASFLLRADAHWLPDDVHPEGGVMPLAPTELGYALPGDAAATLWSVMAGFRLQPGAGVVRGYADALVGVGHLNSRSAVVDAAPASSTMEVRDDTNVALSLGAGVLFAPPGRLALFADVHFDFYAVPGVEGALVPLRTGVRFE